MAKKRKPGKYDAVMGGLTNLPVTDLTRQSKITAIKDSILKLSDKAPKPSALGKEYARLRAEQERLETEQYDVGLRIEALTQMLIETHEADDSEWGQYGAADNALQLVTGGSIRVQKEPIGQVTDKEAFRKWCIKNGYETQLQLWPSTMNAIVKERLLTGDPGPDGTDIFLKTGVVYVPLKVGDD